MLENFKQHVKKLCRVFNTTQNNSEKPKLNLFLHINDASDVVIHFNLTLLNWITKEKFVQFKDERWYSPKRYRGGKTLFFTNEELIKEFEKSL